MARQPAQQPVPEVAQKPAKSRGKLIILVGVGLLALLLSAGGVVYFMLFADKDTAAVPAVTEPVRQVALYQSLEPPFVVNYTHAGRQRYMQVNVVLLGRDQAGMAALTRHLPLVRNQLVMLFSSEEFETLFSPEGKEALRGRATLAVQALLEKEIGSPVIESVLFTNMVLQ